MEFVLLILKTKLEHLENVYQKFVTFGGVESDALAATKNREQCLEIRKAIAILESFLEGSLTPNISHFVDALGNRVEISKADCMIDYRGVLLFFEKALHDGEKTVRLLSPIYQKIETVENQNKN